LVACGRRDFLVALVAGGARKIEIINLGLEPWEVSSSKQVWSPKLLPTIGASETSIVGLGIGGQ
jgi:hypothetical protein